MNVKLNDLVKSSVGIMMCHGS